MKTTFIRFSGVLLLLSIFLISCYETITGTVAYAEAGMVNRGNRAIPVNADTATPHVTLRVTIESGIPPLTVYFSVSTAIPNAVSSYEIDFEGDRVIDYSGDTFKRISFTYTTEGTYHPTVTVTDTEAITYSDTIEIVVLNKTELDTLLKARWDGMNTALMAGDTETALTYIAPGSRASYKEMFNALAGQLRSITATQTELNLISMTDNVATCELVTIENSETYAYHVIFVKNKDGIWMILEF